MQFFRKVDQLRRDAGSSYLEMFVGTLMLVAAGFIGTLVVVALVG